MFSWMIPLLIFIAVWLLALDFQRRRQEAQLRRRILTVAGGTDRARASLWSRGLPGKLFFRMVSALAARQIRWVPRRWGQKVESRLASLGPWQGRSAAEWLAAKELALAGGIILAWFFGAGVWMTLGMAALAFWLPDLWLQEQDQKRRRGIMRELPDLLDLLSSCMEAGLGFEQSVAVILERDRPGALQAEVGELMRFIRMGRSRREALHQMAQRVNEPDFTAFILALSQAEQMGVSVSGTIKKQAGQLRQRRSQQLEKLAMETPVKLLFPLIVFIFPVVFLILFGPIVIKFLHGF